ncbi:MAG TPA: PLD nuclease N-terminal domain-containing protein [Anaerolineae bacterium]|nr:MAG: Negative regulatory protein YxlE [Chloroflexi bacterium ADurb.Bin222]HOC22363.1 PLD nuclease N-terminal domain-containing protein [Anaerolineae bacterium]HQM15567.1 PLD nuclease N-terminal domain-containing protein [Anaerolineae bacterium]
MMDVNGLSEYLPLLIPLVLIQIGLLIFALLDLVKRPEEALNGSKVMWVLIIALVNVIGPILYFIVGRKDE